MTYQSLPLHSFTDNQRALCALAVVTSLALASATGQVGALLLFVGGLAVTFAIFQRPALGAVLVLSLAPLDGVLMIGGHSAVKLASGLCIAVLGVRELIFRRGIRVDSTVWYTGAMLLWAAVTLLWTPDPNRALPILLSFVLQALLYLLLLNLICSKQDLRLALWGYVVGGVVLATVVIITMVSHDFHRVDIGTNLGLNLAARLVALTLLLALLLYQFEVGRIARLFLLGTVVLTTIAVVVALSRGAWYVLLASGIAFIATLLITGRLRFRLAPLGSVCLVGVTVLVLLGAATLDQHAISKLETRVISAVTFSDSASGRFDIWRVGRVMFLDAPLIGHGIDTFANNFSAYIDSADVSDIFLNGISKQPHNAYVRLATEFGIIGVALWFGVVLSVFRRLWSQLVFARTNPHVLAWSAALLAFVVAASMVDSAVDRKYVWYSLCLVSLLITYWSRVTHD